MAVNVDIPVVESSRLARRAEFKFAEDATLGNDLNLHHIWIQGTPIRILAEEVLVTDQQVLGIERPAIIRIVRLFATVVCNLFARSVGRREIAGEPVVKGIGLARGAELQLLEVSAGRSDLLVEPLALIFRESREPVRILTQKFLVTHE